MIADSSLFFKNLYEICRVYVTMAQHGPSLLRFLFQTYLGHENLASYLKNTGGEDLLLPWSRVGHAQSNFYALIGQNLIGEFMRKIFAAS